MATYARGDSDLHKTVQDVMERYHGDLDDAEVTVTVLLAYGPRDAHGDPVGPAITVHGVPAWASIKVTSLRDRAAGMSDAIMLLDGDRIDEWSYEELEAVIDHELTHLELRVDERGNVKRDDLDRPRLAIRRHDWQFGWFDEVARRHGAASPEVRQAKQLAEASGDLYQLYLPGMGPSKRKSATRRAAERLQEAVERANESGVEVEVSVG